MFSKKIVIFSEEVLSSVSYPPSISPFIKRTNTPEIKIADSSTFHWRFQFWLHIDGVVTMKGGRAYYTQSTIDDQTSIL